MTVASISVPIVLAWTGFVAAALFAISRASPCKGVNHWNNLCQLETPAT